MNQETGGLYASLGAHIRRVRESRNATQTDLGRHAQLSRSSIANIEAGRQILNIHQLLLIAEFLQVAPGSLLPTLANEKSAASLPTKSVIDRAILESVDYVQGERS